MHVDRPLQPPPCKPVSTSELMDNMRDATMGDDEGQVGFVWEETLCGDVAADRQQVMRGDVLQQGRVRCLAGTAPHRPDRLCTPCCTAQAVIYYKKPFNFLNLGALAYLGGDSALTEVCQGCDCARKQCGVELCGGAAQATTLLVWAGLSCLCLTRCQRTTRCCRRSTCPSPTSSCRDR